MARKPKTYNGRREELYADPKFHAGAQVSQPKSSDKPLSSIPPLGQDNRGRNAWQNTYPLGRPAIMTTGSFFRRG